MSSWSIARWPRKRHATPATRRSRRKSSPAPRKGRLSPAFFFALQHQHDAEVVHVGARGASDHEVPQRLEERVAVVACKEALGRETLRACTCERVWREHGAGVVLAAVDAIGIASQPPGLREPVEV